MVDIVYFSYVLSFISSILLFVLLIIALTKRWKTLNVLPKGLRLFMITNYFPFVFITAFASGGNAVLYFIYEKERQSISHYFSLILVFTSNIIRNFFCLFVLERIVSTIYLEKYTLSRSAFLNWILTTLSLLLSVLYMAYYIYGVFIFPGKLSLDFLTHIVLVMHLLVACGCTKLYFLNKEMYKVTAYRISLKRRCQIAENIKVLTFLYHSTLIYTIVAPLGSVLYLTLALCNISPRPSSMFYFSQNLALVMICIKWHFSSKSNFNIANTNANFKIVKNAFGQNLPAAISTDKYFRNLQNQWK